MTSLIHPTRGRAAACLETLQKWLGLADNPRDLEYLLGVDIAEIDDYTDTLYVAADLGVKITAFSGDRVGYPAIAPIPSGEGLLTAISKVNHLCRRASGDHLFYIADDFYPTRQGWDTFLSNKGALVAGKVYDADGVFCHPIMSRQYFEQLGYFFHPSYVHVCADTDLMWTSKIDGAFVPSFNHGADAVFVHEHPCIAGHSGTVWDHTLNVANQEAVYDQGNSVLSERHPKLFKESRTVNARHIEFP